MHHLAVALTRNTTLAILDVSSNETITTNGIQSFVVDHPTSLSHLDTFRFEDTSTTNNNLSACAKLIASRLQDNRTLSNISYMYELHPSERFYLDLNRMGRRILYHDEDDVVLRVLPHLLARMTTSKDTLPMLFYCVQERVDLLSSYSSSSTITH